MSDDEWTIRTPQNASDGIAGVFVRFQRDGLLSIEGYDGITTLTPYQAIELAVVLTRWAETTKLNGTA